MPRSGESSVLKMIKLHSWTSACTCNQSELDLTRVYLYKSCLSRSSHTETQNTSGLFILWFWANNFIAFSIRRRWTSKRTAFPSTCFRHLGVSWPSYMIHIPLSIQMCIAGSTPYFASFGPSFDDSFDALQIFSRFDNFSLLNTKFIYFYGSTGFILR